MPKTTKGKLSVSRYPRKRKLQKKKALKLVAPTLVYPRSPQRTNFKAGRSKAIVEGLKKRAIRQAKRKSNAKAKTVVVSKFDKNSDTYVTYEPITDEDNNTVDDSEDKLVTTDSLTIMSKKELQQICEKCGIRYLKNDTKATLRNYLIEKARHI